MASLNKVLLIGNLTRDPELRYTPSGVAVVNLRLAVNRRFKDRSGDLKEDTCFITAVAWDRQAEVCNQYLKKGKPVFIEGRLQSRSWTGNDGQKKNTIEVRADRVQFLGARDAAGTETTPAARTATTDELPAEDIKSENISWEEEENIG